MSIGETLARAREAAGLTIAEVSHRTRIREAIIRDIEQDNYSECGGDFYARGNIRSLARAAGIDPEPLIDEYDEAYREPDTLTDVMELITASRAAPAAAPPPERGRPPLPPYRPGFGAHGRAEQPRLPGGPWLAVVGAVIVLALGGIGFTLLSSSSQPGPVAAGARSHPGSRPPSLQGSGTRARQSTSPAPSPAPTPSPSPSASPRAAAQPLAPASASAFGTGGPGTGDNAELAQMAIDGSKGTAWHSDWYTSPAFGNLYPGTGLLLDMGHPVTVTAAKIALGGGAGADLQLRIGQAPSLGSLPAVARAQNAGGTVQLQPGHPAHGRYVLIWFTRLPPDPAGTFQASVQNVSLTGSG